MGEIIVSLDGYFCSPGHTFDWKHAGVSQVIPQYARPRTMKTKEFGRNLLPLQQPLSDKMCSADACLYSQTTKGG